MTKPVSPAESSGDLKPRSLRPNFDKAKHGLYVTLLANDISSGKPSLNVAISGAYGSGKSSVLEGLLDELKSKKIKSIQVSLATLNQSRDALLEVSGEETLTSALEKEIVKRLLYAAKPTQIPRSRFNRISGFRPWSALILATVISVLLVGAAVTFGVSLPASQMAKDQEWQRWIGLILDLISVGALAFCGQAALSSFRLSQIAVGPATLSLDEKDGNYFDHFLDEIIYFFQRTKNRVVLFEDLDRFNDAGIFLALRELNNLLNSSPQIGEKVTFVYAIRDSLFVKAIESPDDENSDLPDAHARYGADSAASDRAKFFDLIVPVVPFISHEVAADLLLEALGDLPEDLRPTRPLVTLAGRHFTDMRVILSIRNEFEVFAAELLNGSAVRGLSKDQLFAMVVYKHLHLDDFERIRTGESMLDKAVDSIRESVSTLVAAADTSIAEVENAIEVGTAVDQRAKSAGARLLRVLEVPLKPLGWGPIHRLDVDSKSFSRDEVSTKEFWSALAESEDSKLLVHSNGSFEVTAADLQDVLGIDRNPKRWVRSYLHRDRRQLVALQDARSWLLKSPFSELLGGPFPSAVLDEDHEWSRVAEVCGDHIGRGLPFELLRSGYLDQNFALYTTKFHGAILSADGRSYMMQYIDRHRSEPLFKLNPGDVDEIVGRHGEEFLDDPSALNVDIVNRLLEADAPRLPSLLEKSGQGDEFLLTYLANGSEGDQLLRRIGGKRADILDIVSSGSSLSDADRRNGLSVCFSVLSGVVEYGVSSTTLDVISRNLNDLPALHGKLAPEVAQAIASLLSTNDLTVSDLSKVAEPLRSEIASAGSFSIDRANLEALAHQHGAVGLDTLGGIQGGVGNHLIENFPEYVAAVREVPNGFVVDEPTKLDEVVQAIVDHDVTDLTEALALLAKDVRYEDLEDAPLPALPYLAEARAFTLTRSNVTHYIESIGAIDGPLAAWLSETKKIHVDVTAEDSTEEQAARQVLAAEIVTSDLLDSSVTTPLVVSLNTSTHLDIDDLELDDPVLAVDLLSAGEIADNLTTFKGLAEGPWLVFEACAANSSIFTSLLDELTFTDDLLAKVLTSRSISVEARRAVLSKFDLFHPTLGSASSTAWIEASLRLRVPLTAGQLLALAQAGARSEQLVTYIGSGRTELAVGDLTAIFAHCDEPYSRLASADRSRFTIPFSNDFRPILQILKDGAIVRNFHKKRRREEFEVQMEGDA